MTVQIIRGDALALPLPDGCVDLVCTSPPFFGLRSYQDNGEHYAGQLGSEATPAEFVDALIAATREMVRVLKPAGSIWVNLGDKYAGSSIDNRERAPGPSLNNPRNSSMRSGGVIRPPVTSVRAKSLIGIPWRYALRCIDDLGLILRAEVIWSKPNGLPESVTDRVRRSHETWFHFTKEPRYFSAVDEIREQAERSRPQASRAAALAAKHGLTDAHRDALLSRGLGDQGRSAATQSGTGKNTADVLALAAEADAALGSYTREFTMTSQSLGKLPGSVWTIPTQPLTVPAHLGVDHFAAFPFEWPRRIIAGWSPAGVCTGCGEGRRPVVDSLREVNREKIVKRTDAYGGVISGGVNRSTLGDSRNIPCATITGSACACGTWSVPNYLSTDIVNWAPKVTGRELPPAEPATRPGVVLDPFGGTGTTALVAHVNGRHGISVDYSADYCRLARWRTTDPNQLAAAALVDKPPVECAGQESLFDLEATR